MIMEHNQHYEKLKAIVDKCDRCGACTTVCPLYKVDRKDRATSRGKIAIVRALLEDKLDGNEKALRHALDYCLLCKACTEVCPGKVMTDQAMIEMRQWLREDHGLSAKISPHRRLHVERSAEKRQPALHRRRSGAAISASHPWASASEPHRTREYAPRRPGNFFPTCGKVPR